MTQSQLGRELEALTDVHGLANVINELYEMCIGKADHIRESWQDPATARSWDRAAQRLDTTRDQLVSIDQVQFTR